MGTNLKSATLHGSEAASTTGALHSFEQQCMRILRCTAVALANSPGGLRFKAGTKPWLDAITDCKPHFPFSTQNGG